MPPAHPGVRMWLLCGGGDLAKANLPKANLPRANLPRANLAEPDSGEVAPKVLGPCYTRPCQAAVPHRTDRTDGEILPPWTIAPRRNCPLHVRLRRPFSPSASIPPSPSRRVRTTVDYSQRQIAHSGASGAAWGRSAPFSESSLSPVRYPLCGRCAAACALQPQRHAGDAGEVALKIPFGFQRDS